MAMPWPVLLMSRALGPGGTERQLALTARSLDRSLFQPHVGCFVAGGARADELAVAGVPVAHFGVHSFLSASLLREAGRMARYLKRHRIQLVHTFDAPMNLFGVPVARACGLRAAISSQRSHRDLYPGWYRQLLRFTDHMADGVVVNCEAVRRQLVEQDRVPEGRIWLCHNGIDTEVFRPLEQPPPEALRDASLVVGVVSVLRPEKDLETLLRAFAQIRGLRPGLKLAVVGEGPLQEQLQVCSRTLGLDSSCHFEPPTVDIARWLRAIDIFVLPSVSEAFSNSLMEAMACGCCAVASRVGGNPELVTHEQTGLLFPPRDVAGLAAALRRLIEQESLRRQLAERGRERIHSQFSAQAAARRMAQLYLSLLTTTRGSAGEVVEPGH